MPSLKLAKNCRLSHDNKPPLTRLSIGWFCLLSSLDLFSLSPDSHSHPPLVVVALLPIPAVSTTICILNYESM